MSLAWVAPVGAQLDLLTRWLEPILERPGLAAVPPDRLRVVVCEADSESAPLEFEPFDVLVGPARMTADGVVADVIPLEPFVDLVGNAARPQIVFAHGTGEAALEPIEANASAAVLIERLLVVDLDA